MTRGPCGALTVLVLILVGCDKTAPPAPEAEQHPNAAGVAISSDDPLAVEIRRAKDLLREDRIDEAWRAMRNLELKRDEVPLGRRIEIDRLHALFAGVR